MTDPQLLRDQITRLLAETKESDAAYVHAADLIARCPRADWPVLRLAILRSYTIEPLVEVLTVKAFLEGLRLELFLSEFNQYQQELVDRDSRLYAFRPDVTFLAVRLEELVPWLFTESTHGTPHVWQTLEHDVVQTVSDWLDCLEHFGGGTVLVSNFLTAAASAQGLSETQTLEGQVALIRRLNLELVRLRERYPHVYVFDLEHLASIIGQQPMCDPLQWYRMANPFRLQAYPALGEALMAHLRAILGRRRKCVVLDLDGTLWGGTIGEDGMTGLTLSDTYPGNCFKDFQRALRWLAQRGILLAINSKNNEAEAMEAIRSHPDMLLREADFSAMRINWRDKAENLREIAQELNLGLNAMVFIDDSPVECERIRQACPEVLVIQLPDQPHLYRGRLETLGCFDQLTITAEDRARGTLYHSQARRQQLAAQAPSLDAFYASLNMRATMARNERLHIPRIAQLTHKTNQFNLTTRRYTDAQISRFMEEGSVYSMQVADRFSDNGIIAVAIVLPSADGEEWAIDTFLMSCRVMMRTIEETLLAQLAEDAKAGGARRLVGWYVPTERNQVVEGFYRRRGFAIRARETSGTVEHVFDLTGEASLPPSPWITLATADAALPR